MIESKEKEISFEEFENTLKLGNEIGELSRNLLLTFIDGGIERNAIIKIIKENTITSIDTIISKQEKTKITVNKFEKTKNNIKEEICEKALEYGNQIGNCLREGLKKLLKSEKSEININNLLKEITQETNNVISNILHIMGKNPNQEIIENLNKKYPKRQIKINISGKKGLENVFNPKNLGKPPIYPGDPRYPNN